MANPSFKRLLVFHIQKHFLKTTPQPTVSAPLESSSSSSSFTVQYLMKECGLPLDTALSTSQKFQLEEKNQERHGSVISLLKSHHFTDAHISKLVTKRPDVLNSRADSNLKPKLQYLIDNGFVGLLLPNLITRNPIILRRGLSSHIKPSIELLKTYLETDEKIVAAVKRAPWLLTFDLKGIMQPNIEFLLSQGVPSSNISKLMVMQPRTILHKVDRVACAVETVKKLGLNPSASMFIHAVYVMVSLSESTWKRKVNLLKNLGWSDQEVMSAFKREPFCLACSEEKITSLMNFYVNTVKLEPGFIAAHPRFLMYAKDTRIRPRFYVLKVLESKKLLKEVKNTYWILAQTEKRFLDTYVYKHLDRVPLLLELYRGNITPDKIDTT